MLKKILTLLAIITVFCTGCAQKEQNVSSDLEKILERGNMIVGVKTDSYPFGYIDKNGKNAGYDIDIANLIGKEIFGQSGKVKFVPVTTSDRIMKLLSEDVDMLIATMSVNKTREQYLDFSSSYYIAGQAVLTRNISKIRSLKDLNGKKVVIIFGSTAESNLRAAVPNAKIIGYKTYNEAYNAIKTGKADAIVSDDSILLGYALKDKSVKLLPKRYTKEPYAVAFRKGHESDDLVRTVSGIINQAERTGKLKHIRHSHGLK